MAKNNPTPETGLSLKDKLSRIQVEFKANKSRYNSFGKYNFRSAEDILEALKPINEKYNVFFTVQESFKESNLNIPIIISTAMIVDCDKHDENTPAITASAIVGVDLGQKGMQTPQAFGSASSYAKKYALGNLLLIDDTADADATNKHDKSEAPAPSEPEKEWLNKGTENFNKAINYIAEGGDIELVKKKYKISKEVLDELINIEKK
jgi:hypothetical protein